MIQLKWERSLALNIYSGSPGIMYLSTFWISSKVILNSELPVEHLGAKIFGFSDYQNEVIRYLKVSNFPSIFTPFWE